MTTSYVPVRHDIRAFVLAAAEGFLCFCLQI